MRHKVVPFQPWHLKWVVEGGSTEGIGLFNDAALDLIPTDNAKTVVVDDAVMACLGTIQFWQGRHEAWASISTKSGPFMRAVTSAARDIIRAVPGRVECTVRTDFMQGNRWVKLLGFEIENPPGVLKGYGPYGEDHHAYAFHTARDA